MCNGGCGAGDFNYIEVIANSKSGQFFFYSHDGKYMIKTQTKEESLLRFGTLLRCEERGGSFFYAKDAP